MTTLQPTLKDERIQVLDVLRGIAIFGILFVNLAHFSYPDVYLSVLGKDNFFTEKWSDLDFGVRMILDLLIQTKFILLFSFLFGFGMVVMMERSLSKYDESEQHSDCGSSEAEMITIFLSECSDN